MCQGLERALPAPGNVDIEVVLVRDFRRRLSELLDKLGELALDYVFVGTPGRHLAVLLRPNEELSADQIGNFQGADRMRDMTSLRPEPITLPS